MERKQSMRLAFAAVLLTGLIVAPYPGATAVTCAPTKTSQGAAWPGGEWRSYGADLSNTRDQAAESTIGPSEATSLAPVWTLSMTDAGADGDVTGTPVIADGCLFVGTTTGSVIAANADTGQPLWVTRIAQESSFWQGGIFGSPAVTEGKVIVAVARTSSPFVMALDQKTGAPAWASPTVVDTQSGSELYSSPVVYDDDTTDARPAMLILGVSGGAAELGDDAERHAFHGSVVVLDSESGALLKKIWTIPQNAWDEGYAGGNVWAPTVAVDPATDYAYAATGNPFQPQVQHPHTNAIVKIDLDRSRRTFGTIVDSYQGTVDEYFTEFADQPCVDGPINAYPQGLGSCFDLDLDFGTSVNIIREGGRLVVGAGQKSGVYHAAYADTMDPAWNALVGNPSAVGGVVGSAAYHDGAVTGPITPVGLLWSLDAGDGGYRWFSPVADVLHYGPPVSSANGVVYTVDFKGFLDAYDAATGIPVLHAPMGLGTGSPIMPSLGGVSIARNTVYASAGTGTGRSSGGVVAFRPGGGGGGGDPEPPPGPGLPTAGLAVVALPGAASTTYATPVMVVRAGDEQLSFVNVDVPLHDVVSRDGLFSSPLIGAGGSAPVTFNQHLAAGQSYAFYCSLHANMTGTLVAV